MLNEPNVGKHLCRTIDIYRIYLTRLCYVLCIWLWRILTYKMITTSIMSTNSYVFYFILLSLYILDKKTSFADKNELSSSVWCTQDKLCTFQNLCYHPESEQFLFVLSDYSIIHGVESDQFNQLELSSVRNHNRMFMNLTVVSQVNEILSSAVFEEERLFVIHSFKRDNIMHVIHDDLLPLFSTYLLLCGGDVDPCISKYRLAFVNGQEQGPYEKWYQTFTKQQPLLLSLSDHEIPVTCFKEVRIGLVRTSLWFDYGFSGVQGRLKDAKISGKDLRKFRDYVLRTMNVSPARPVNGCAVFVKRSVNRKILNEEFVKEAVIQFQKIHKSKSACIHEVDLLKDSSDMVLTAVSQSDLLVGMHGAGMALAVFLPLGATILELFPFAIDPYNVSPVMAMCDLADVGIFYTFWRNQNRSLSVPPSTTDPLGGSISHLPTDRQKEILQLEKVDAVPCCHDPAYLYYMFQDTVVSNDFPKTLQNVIKHSQEFYFEDFIFDSYANAKMLWMLPGPIYNIGCDFNNERSVKISWTEPVNSADFDHLYYEVLVLLENQPVFSGKVQGTQLDIPAVQGRNLKLWITTNDESEKLKSKDVFYECS